MLKFVLKILVLAGTLLFTSSAINPVFAASIGVSPAGITNENLKPGSTVTQKFIISRATPNEDVVARIEIDAAEISSWLTIQPSDRVHLPAGEQRVPFTITVNVPENAQYGKYEGYVRVILEGEEKGQVTIQPAVRLDINLILTEKDIKLIKVNNATIENYYYGDPMILFLDFTNEGNVPAAPDSIKVEVYTEAMKYVGSVETNKIPNGEPFQQSTVQVKFNDVSFTAGTYVAEIFVNEQNDVIYNGKSIFEVYKSGKTIEDKDGESKNFIQKIKENILDLLKNNWNSAKSFAKNNFKYILMGFVSLSFILILLLLVLDRNRDDEDKKGKQRIKK